MRRLFYILFLFVCVSCTSEMFSESDSVIEGFSSEISPAACISSPSLPPAATKALIDITTVTSLEANVLKIDESMTGDYTFGSWKTAYLAEATLSAMPSGQNLRTMSLNPVQAYSYDDDSSTPKYYHTRMISWYPRTCNLHKNEDGKASLMTFETYKTQNDDSVYTETDGDISLNFKNLDGSKDVMVSNIVEGQFWHLEAAGEQNFRFPFGYNEANPSYSNYMTYKHYLSAIKVYASVQNSDQVVSMWGAIRKVFVKNQPSEISVNIKSPSVMSAPTIEGNVQNNPSFDTSVTFSGTVDFPLIKTPMYGTVTDDANDPGIAEDAPYLGEYPVYLGYAMIKPYVSGEQNLELEVHTDTGVLSLSVPMAGRFAPGYIYTVNISFNTEGAIADIVMKSGSEHYYDLSTGHEYDKANNYQYQHANCYIVHPGIVREEAGVKVPYDGYAFSATIVGSAQGKWYPEFASDRTTVEIDPVRAGLLWETSPGLITQIEYLYGYVRFKVKQGQTGNAVIAAYDSQRKVLWSWHIWVTDEPQPITFFLNGDKTITLLDRNLGATAREAGGDYNLIDTYGLYYQWGRKDPSMGPPDDKYRPQSTETSFYYDYYGTQWNYAGVVSMDRPGIRDGVENPMYLLLPFDFSMTGYRYDWMYESIDNLWGDHNDKTIYDPCPYGYMVPQDEISTLFASAMPKKVDGGYVMQVDGKEIDGSFFPFAGYKGVDKGVSSLSGAWRYVGQKGDYMSAKIELNGHRSRTYISESPSWIEYGADQNNDGHGDASRTYNSNINADDMTNRRTAASVRCVRISDALGSSVSASFIGDRAYAFVGDGKITFSYDVTVLGGGDIVSAYIDWNGTKLSDLSVNGNHIDGKIAYDIPAQVGSGLARYRLVTQDTNGAVSRISYTLRLFDIDALKLGEEAYDPDPEVGYDPDIKYDVSFTLLGLESDLTVTVNGKPATKTDSNKYSVDDINVNGHLHIQIFDANGGLACEKSYDVKMKEMQNIEYDYEFLLTGEYKYITSADELEGGGLYMISPFAGHNGANYYYWLYDNTTGKLNWIYDRNLTIDKTRLFRFHISEDKAVSVPATHTGVTAGAWYSVAAERYLKNDFTFGSESEAVYVTCANPPYSSLKYPKPVSGISPVEFFLDPSTYLCFNHNQVPCWSSDSWIISVYQYRYQWYIYPIKAIPKKR